MRNQPIIAVLLIAFAQFWSVSDTAAEDIDAVARAYALQATDTARKVVLAELVKHPERVHRVSMTLKFQIDRQGHPHNVDVRSTPRNPWAEDAARRALRAAKFPPLPQKVLQRFGTDLASFEAQLDLDASR
jgi:TonB family protein